MRQSQNSHSVNSRGSKQRKSYRLMMDVYTQYDPAARKVNRTIHDSQSSFYVGHDASNASILSPKGYTAQEMRTVLNSQNAASVNLEQMQSLVARKHATLPSDAESYTGKRAAQSKTRSKVSAPHSNLTALQQKVQKRAGLAVIQSREVDSESEEDRPKASVFKKKHVSNRGDKYDLCDMSSVAPSEVPSSHHVREMEIQTMPTIAQTITTQTRVEA